MEFKDVVIQWDPRFAFVETAGSDQGRQYLLVDAAGKVYTKLSQGWDKVYASPDGVKPFGPGIGVWIIIS